MQSFSSSQQQQQQQPVKALGVFPTVLQVLILFSYTVAGCIILWQWRNNTNACGNIWYYDGIGVFWCGVWGVLQLVALRQQRSQTMYDDHDTCATIFTTFWNLFLSTLLLIWGAYEFDHLPSTEMCPRDAQWIFYAITFCSSVFVILCTILTYIRDWYIARNHQSSQGTTSV